MVNIPLLRKAVEWVEEQDKLAESKWYQGSWFRQDVQQAKQDLNDPMCGSSMCVAGKVAMDDGWKPVLNRTHSFDGTAASPDRLAVADYATKEGTMESIEEVGRSLLGLTKREADRLFDGGNSARDIRLIAEDIAGERL